MLIIKLAAYMIVAYLSGYFFVGLIEIATAWSTLRDLEKSEKEFRRQRGEAEPPRIP